MAVGSQQIAMGETCPWPWDYRGIAPRFGRQMVKEGVIMYVAIDLTGDMISYAYPEGNEVTTEVLRNTIGFRTKDLFRVEGAMNGMIRMVKDMIELTVGATVSEAICVVPAYCTFPERERIRKAGEECGLTIRRMIKGSFGSAMQLFQSTDLGTKQALLCDVHSDYTEFLIFNADGAVFEAKGAAVLQYDKNPQDQDKLREKLKSEVKTLYSGLGLSMAANCDAIYVTFDENTDALRGFFLETLITYFGKEPVIFENDTAKGAFYHLLKLESAETVPMKKCFPVDCCIEGISIGSGVGGDLKEVFLRNTPLPAQKTVDRTISYDTVVCFYAGNYRNREYDEPIGTCRIPDQYRSQTIHVKITLTEDAMVEYVVLDASKQIIYPRRKLS